MMSFGGFCKGKKRPKDQKSTCKLMKVLNHGTELCNQLSIWMTDRDIKAFSQSDPDLFGDMAMYRKYVHLKLGDQVRDLGLLYQGLVEVKLDDIKVMHQILSCGRVAVTRAVSRHWQEECVGKKMQARRPVDALSTVQKLDLSSMTSVLGCVDVKTIFPYFPAIVSLNLSNVEFKAHAFEAMLAALPCSLLTLDLSSIVIGFVSFEHLPTGVRVLKLGNTHLGSRDTASLVSSLRKCHSLEEFYVPGFIGTDVSEYVDLFASLSAKSLRKLTVKDGWSIHPEVAVAIAGVFQRAPSIEVFDVALWNSISAFTLFECLAKSPPPSLKELFLYGNIGEAVVFLLLHMLRCFSSIVRPDIHTYCCPPEIFFFVFH